MRPVRSPSVLLAIMFGFCVVCAAAGGAVARFVWPLPAASCPAIPPGDVLQAELVRAQLALTQERASKATIQHLADASAAELAHLKNDLRVLRSVARPRDASARR
ncbi:hypothetical protein [Burkholderia singularis]|uniref:hypothetical protein n=1 Tax=Burkholderia singularis TaxID=1503053 RepID=UPI00135AD91D|nr:hypothetical protein [Burkholderia singularis]